MNFRLQSHFDVLNRLTDQADYALVGPRDNRIHEIRTDRFPFNTVCHIGRDFGNRRWSGCTGVLIRPRVVLTAGHCVYNLRRGRAPLRIRVVPGRADRDTMPCGFILSGHYYAPRRYIRLPHPRHPDRRYFDYGIIILPRPFPGIRKFMDIRALSDSELRDSDLISVAGYPGDRPRGTMWRHTENLRRITSRRLFYTVDTCPGHSGSPVWCRAPGSGKRTIIGIHTSGIVDPLGRSYGCKKGTVLAPPGLLNSGVRINREVLANIRHPDRQTGVLRPMVRLP
ncbi:serine protease [Desulfonema ishimotonii]|uniref:Serine protease n=2 Tax=Desulfonema ishimotonii TaxID=45657 RepID=A0A401FTX1_9BACT|nr:serine protease [Desulfonema ishimotonii]